jgi:hypothetical protein
MLPFRKKKIEKKIVIVRRPNPQYIHALKMQKLMIIKKNIHINEVIKNDNDNDNEFIIDILNELASNNLSKINNSNEIPNIINYITEKYNEKCSYSFNPDVNNKKFLFLIASHTDSELKLKNVKTLVNLLSFSSIEIRIINTEFLTYSNDLKEFCKENNVYYEEGENYETYDFGKWNKLLSKVNYNSYDYIFFSNDSFKIEDSINHFINLTVKNDVELYGYNDCTEQKYHYQTYLFSIKSNAVYKFIKMFILNKNSIKNQQDVINIFELNLIKYFSSHDCFLKIGEIPCNIGLNIFFYNDYLYEMLKNTGVLPFVKLKRII